MSDTDDNVADVFVIAEQSGLVPQLLEEYLEKNQIYGLHVTTKTAFKETINVLRKGLDVPMQYELFQKCLLVLAHISVTDPDLFVDGKTPGLIFKVWEKILTLRCSEAEESKRSVMTEAILEITTAIADASDKGKSAVSIFVHPCFNVLVDERETPKTKTEATKFLNTVIELYMQEHGGKLGELPFALEKFDDLMAKAGDLELQLCTTELICRILPYKKRYLHAQQWFKQHSQCRNDFLAIRDAEFESDSRLFINNFNERQLENRSVYSVLCKEVYLGSFKVDCPREEQIGMFWTDFNLGSKSITFFAMENDNWETVVIHNNAISQTKILEKKEKNELLLVLRLNQFSHTLLSFCKPSNDCYVKFVYDKKNSPEIAASLLFPSDSSKVSPPSPDVIASTPKASVTSQALHLSSRAKGVAKAVPLSSTPRRSTGSKESSDDSKSKVLAPNNSEKPAHQNKQKNPSSNNQDGNLEIRNPSVADKNKSQKAGDVATRHDSVGLSDSDGSVSKAKQNRRRAKAKDGATVPIIQVESSDEGSRVRTRSSRSNDSDSTLGKHTTQNGTTKERDDQTSLKPSKDESVKNNKESSTNEEQKQTELHTEDGTNGRQEESVDDGGKIENDMDIGDDKAVNGMDTTGQPNESKSNRNNLGTGTDESGLSKSVDSGLGKSMDKQELTTEDGAEHGRLLEDTGLSQDEPTVINETQTFTQEDEENVTKLGEVLSKDQDEDPLSAITKPRPGDGKEEGGSSGPFLKPSKVSEKTTTTVKESESEVKQGSAVVQREETKTAQEKKPKGKKSTTEENEGESSTVFKTTTTKPIKGKTTKRKESITEENKGESSTVFETKTTKPTKPIKEKTTKTRQLRTRAASKKNASISRSVSTSESEIPIDTAKRVKTRAKSAGATGSGSTASTRSQEDFIDKRNRLGSGYNTEDWVIGMSDVDRRIAKKEVFKNLRNGTSRTRLSLINTVFRDTYKSDFKRKRVKQLGPYEFKCSPPIKRTPQGKKLLRPALKAYQTRKKNEVKKHAELQKKKKKSTQLDLSMENQETEEEEEEDMSFSDIVLASERRIREQQRQHHSETEVSYMQSELLEENDKIKNIGEEKSGKRTRTSSENLEVDSENLGVKKEGKEENVPIEQDETIPTFHAEDTSQFNVDGGQISNDLATEPEDELYNLVNEFLHDSTFGNEENVDRNLAKESEEDATKHIDQEETIHDEHDAIGTTQVEKNAEKIEENSSNGQRRAKSRVSSNQESRDKVSRRSSKASLNRTRGARNLWEESKGDEVFEGNGDEDDKTTEIIDNQRKKQGGINRTQNAKSSSNGNESKSKPPTKRQQEPRRQARSKATNVYLEEDGEELHDGAKAKGSLREKETTRKSLNDDKDDDEDYMSSSVVEAFRKSFEKIIEESDGCMDDTFTSANKVVSSSKKQSETATKSKGYLKSSRNDAKTEEFKDNEQSDDDDDDDEREESVNKGQESPESQQFLNLLLDSFKSDVETPKVHSSRTTDSGFFDKTSSTSSKKRTYDKRNQTPGSAKSEALNETTSAKLSARKSRRLGRLDLQPSDSCTLHRGYHSNDGANYERRTSAEENECNFFSQPTPVNQGKRKREGRYDADVGLKSGSRIAETPRQLRKVYKKADDYEHEDNPGGEDGQDYAYDEMSFKTPNLDIHTSPIAPRKLFQSRDHPTTNKRRKVSSHENEEDEEAMEDDDFDDVVSMSEEVKMTIANLGNEMRKTIKQKRDYVSQMATATMKVITGKSEEMWKKQSSKRNALVNEFTRRVNKYIGDHHEVTKRRQEVEDDMFAQLKKQLDSVANHRREQETCLRSIIKTQKAFTETFRKIEDTAQSQHADFQKSLRKELFHYRDQAAAEVQKQEIANLKRRIQAMLATSL